ncbi:1-acyl-sn-glycerol-3-phosphate acyltransferase [Wenxinia marina]|uniref:Glycerol-3-phosphate acyltransferase n=1 Tax=Wenxinia marina DSM 24838 TaxID=1123501 RepID=A0A0D0Q7S8_9RHOB|nr:1-acyl-sn-glycerol-3-phosphate acyltransferase [Wenxinia marina]KIQ70514.1 glycerol-3-phosphate acyltransferase [Wenxinia marina DSM 24838]GGL52531.1 glycerol-3-phosphate 1-O-acyltransferase [Wenxinia marina]
MFRPVEIPLWLLILILLFAAVTFASHFLFPSVRWFLRRRAERLVARLNTRLRRPIEPFRLARRHDMIQRLSYDPAVVEAVVEYARREGVREDVAFEKAQDYAREIVPSFSATAYFTFGTRIARWLSTSLYRMRTGAFDRDDFDMIDPDATVIFVISHRSNMDYVLVTYLASRASALSYAVGEWARVWPLSAIIRAMGAYFIRRGSRGALYRRVLARYVQMATDGGVTQAIFPEGGLSLDGRIAAPRLGLISYIADGQETRGRDVVFVPVALNYDRVLEDTILIAAGLSGRRRFRPPIFKALWGLGAYLLRFVTFRTRPYGAAAVGFGAPLSLTAFRAADPEAGVEALANELMDRVRSAVPVLPVPLVARAVLGGAVGTEAIEAKVAAAMAQLDGSGVSLPRRDPAQVTEDAMRILRDRRLMTRHGRIGRRKGAEDVLRFYAASIAHHFPEEEGSSAVRQT